MTHEILVQLATQRQDHLADRVRAHRPTRPAPDVDGTRPTRPARPRPLVARLAALVTGA